MEDSLTFSFGRNWQNFSRVLDGDRHERARLSLAEFLGVETLEQKTFLDIGCGSGLFSHAAYRLGAKQVLSFDVDPLSVECCERLHKEAGSPENWRVHTGSVLDEGLISQLGKFDVVYSWGVLHHTGSMWDAIRNSASLVGDGGRYYIALYNNVGGIRGSRTWWKIKRLYNRSPAAGQRLLESTFTVGYLAGDLIRLKNPIKTIRNYRKNRGMSWRTDIIDWLGGYPYEYATVEEVFKFMKAEFPHMTLVNIKTTNGLGTNSFLFANGAV